MTQAQKATGEKDALVVLRGQLKGLELVTAAFEFSFMGGSMGSVVGERFVQGVMLPLSVVSPWSVSPLVAVRVCRSRSSL